MPTNPDRTSYFPAIEKKHGLPMSYWFEQMEQVKDRKYAEQIAFLRENHGFSQAHANALVLYCRGSATSRRFDTLEGYLAEYDETRQHTVRRIFAVLQAAYPGSEVVIAWNKPMLKLGDDYLFGVSVHQRHVLIAPWGDSVVDRFGSRLAGYEVNKKTIKVPVDWEVDEELIVDMVAARLEQLAQE